MPRTHSSRVRGGEKSWSNAKRKSSNRGYKLAAKQLASILGILQDADEMRSIMMSLETMLNKLGVAETNNKLYELMESTCPPDESDD